MRLVALLLSCLDVLCESLQKRQRESSPGSKWTRTETRRPRPKTLAVRVAPVDDVDKEADDDVAAEFDDVDGEKLVAPVDDVDKDADGDGAAGFDDVGGEKTMEGMEKLEKGDPLMTLDLRTSFAGVLPTPRVLLLPAFA